MIVIGLTGGIASGKSTVARTLAELGAEVINADDLGHDLYQPGTETWEAVVSQFGERILLPDKTINRRELGEIVFRDPLALQRLNGIMHPRMYREVSAIIGSLRSRGTTVVVLEAALLVEAGWICLVDEIWLTTVQKEIAAERLLLRDRISQKEAFARINSQIPVAERKRVADVIIDTSASYDQVKAKVTELWQELHLRIAAKPSFEAEQEQLAAQKEKEISPQLIRELLISGKHLTDQPPVKGIPSAVVVPLFQKEDHSWHILFTKRTETVAHHRGQISFPGGTRDTRDRTLKDTALRETYEEIGVPEQNITILGQLENQHTREGQFIITPFVGLIPYPHYLTINPAEIDFILEVPLKHFLIKNTLRESFFVYDSTVYTTYHSSYQGQLIWGATATILRRFLSLLFPTPA